MLTILNLQRTHLSVPLLFALSSSRAPDFSDSILSITWLRLALISQAIGVFFFQPPILSLW